MINKIIVSALFLFCLFSAFFWPNLASAISNYSPVFMTDYLLYWPQLSLPYDNLVVRDLVSNTPVFSTFTGKALNIIQWVIVTILFSFTVGKLRNKFVVVSLSFATIIIVPIIVYNAIKYFGYTILIVNP